MVAGMTRMRFATPTLLLACTFALLAPAACGGSNTKAPPSPAPVTAPAAAAECHEDSDCAVAVYDAPADAASCCTLSCERPVVTQAEAARRQQAWEAICSGVRCRPPSCEVSEPEPACRDERCVSRTP